MPGRPKKVRLRTPPRPAGRAPVVVIAPDGTVLGASMAQAARVLGVTYQALYRVGSLDGDGVLRLSRLPQGRRRSAAPRAPA